MMRRWLLLMMLVLTTVNSFGQVKRYDTDFFVLAGSVCHIIAVWDVLMEYL